jgi:hypothetical protein
VTDRVATLLSRLERSAPAPRGDDGEVRYAEPWQARLVAVTACALDASGVDRFAAAFADALTQSAPDAADAPGGYYTAWLRALESHVAAADAASA